MPDINALIEELKQTRDELKLKIHLGSKDLQDEWEELEKKFTKFSREAELEKSASEIGDAAGDLGGEIAKAYRRIREAL